MIKLIITGGDPAPPELLDVIQNRARSVLRRYVDATSNTPFCNCHGGQDCLNPFTATREISKSFREDTVKQITLTATFQMNRSDDSLEQDNEDGGFPDDPISNRFGEKE